MRVIFTLFLPADVENYTNALQAVFQTDTPKQILPLIPPQVIQTIRNADAIIVRAGAGLSADAVHKELGFGLDYTSTDVFSALYPGLLKSTKMRCLYDTVRFSSAHPPHELKSPQFGNDFPDVRRTQNPSRRYFSPCSV